MRLSNKKGINNMKSLKDIKLCIIDVDGTMTDGGIYYDDTNEIKKFNTKDAAGFFCLTKMGCKIMVLTGRYCMATERRMKELGVDFLFQNVKNKTFFLKDFANKNNIDFNEIAYIGDDLNDLNCMQLAGLVGCPADSCPEIKLIADYVSNVKGGNGAVRDVIEHWARQSGVWKDIIRDLYCSGV